VKKIGLSRNFMIFWMGQFVSSFGSTMTSFAISIWMYQEQGRVLFLSLASVAIVLPKMLGGIFASPFVERFNKKWTMILTDIGAGICTFLLLLLFISNQLEIWHIYVLNIVSSLLSSIQQPTADVMISRLVEPRLYTKASGLQLVSSGMSNVLSPALAAVMLSLTGMIGIIIIDLGTLIFACFTLLFWVQLPVDAKVLKVKYSVRGYFKDIKEGFQIFVTSKILRSLLMLMAAINIFAGMTYYHLLTPMILARTNFDEGALAIVNSAMGIGGILGGIAVSLIPDFKSKLTVIFSCSLLSFLCGDILLALGNTIVIWAVGIFFSSFFLPFLNANESYLWRVSVPIDFQGRVFAFKYGIQSGMIPIGIICGGVLADFVFEPYMLKGENFFNSFLGSNNGSGMALMFFGTGILGSIVSLIGLLNRRLRKLELELNDCVEKF
jgi:DHA3 family macrolide efflux protein-like MFS transporter